MVIGDCMRAKKVGDCMKAMAMYDVLLTLGWLRVNATWELGCWLCMMCR